MIKIYCDGGSRGNPGKSACAIVIVRDETIVFEEAYFIGISTNNFAEYRGLIASMKKAIEMKEKEVEFIMDSLLVIKQMNREYEVKSENLKSLNLEANNLSSKFVKTRFTHVRRTDKFISRADYLLNCEMDRH
ncbi:MAG: ribonuclease HI family protein [archaeon]|nr:ribonuclease HI family protein [archaeon]